MVGDIVILGGKSHPALTEQVSWLLGVKPSSILIGKFSSGETRVEINASVREKDIFIIQSNDGDVNDSLMELLVTISACRISSARRIVAVLPLFPYSKQSDSPYERTDGPLPRAPNGLHSTSPLSVDAETGQPVSSHDGLGLAKPTNGYSAKTNHMTTASKQWHAKPGTLVANLLTAAGVDHIVTIDLHNAQYQGFFNIPVDNLYARSLMKNYIRTRIPNHREVIVVSPDAGGAKRATAVADELGLDFALIHKIFTPGAAEPKSYSSETDAAQNNNSMILVGDVKDRTAVLIDDLAETCETLTNAAQLLKANGASTVIAMVTHGILIGDAVERVNQSSIDRLVVTNSIPQDEHCKKCSKIEVIQIEGLLAETIRRIHYGESFDVFHC